MKRGLLALLLLACAPAHAEQFVRQGEFIVHYAALNTTALAPDVARQFGVARSAGRALLVLNAQRETAPGKTESIPASARGIARSLIGHEQKLELRAIREGDVHYLIAVFQVLNQEYLTLDLQVTPQGAAAALPLKFQQQFYTD